MLTLAKDSQAPRMARHTIYVFRLVLAAVWLFWGVRDGLVLQLVGAAERGKNLAGMLGLAPSIFSILVGWLMLLLGIWVISGLASRVCGLCQIALLAFLWWIYSVNGGYLLGSIFEQLPMIALMVMVWIYGPGTCVWRKKRLRSTWTRG